ncbi:MULTISPECIES: phosphate/phosphite/phosphonate ABC transporter substrate-binding protein [unclassified Colwellia]|uniref:phosphate/phosphite/phosphonate ABC transporter substrate-binding protein n=1 Tax=unclassified Colwellia TaxID=196834 RepID=UPI0015F60B96|nr:MULTISPECIES: PhnD/SsuA/transferrin family substrate-binding protein [unclassified Colwellia]MBA6251097.1 phosphate/phosphite/phosphonate ABC transporter substrate-binding protein [Colwellia sp. MB3u-55]MBA6398165.1 phosphate/phosphite/phosphonate ABC transporter substrate-binding protein [Colwellia sp. BRX10-4]
MKKLLIIFIAYLLSACEQKTTDNTLQYSSTSPNDNGVIIYRLAIHPLHNPQKLFEAYQPLVDYLNSELQYIKIELEASRDYRTFEKKFRARQPELLLPNPWQTLQAMDSGYHVIGMAGDADDFKGIFIVRKDNDIIEPLQLEGKRVSYPAPTALAAAIMPQYFLYTHGIDINQHTENVYVGSQESSIMNVYLSNVTVGATWPPSWRSFKKDNPEQAKQLKVVWQTPSLINNSVMIRDDVPDKISKQIQSLLINLGDSEHGQVILTGMETARITSANDEDYDVVRTYIKNFEDKVRPVENK